MIYVSCNHQQLHNGGWLEEMHLSIAGKQERVAIAPCRLQFSRFDRVHSWLATLTIVLHRKIVHEEVLRQLLVRRYGYWFGFWSVPELMLGLPVFYRHLASRYYLLRDVVPSCPNSQGCSAGYNGRQFPKLICQLWRLSAMPGPRMKWLHPFFPGHTRERLRALPKGARRRH